MLVAGTKVRASWTLRATVQNLVNAAHARREAFARTGSMAPDSEESREVSRLVRDLCGLTGYAVTEQAAREWVA